MTTATERARDGALVLLASLMAWGALSKALQTPDATTRGVLLAVPPIALAWVAFPEFMRQWWARIAVSSALFTLALYGAQKLYYPMGGASPACALTGLVAGAVLATVALLANPRAISHNRWVFLGCGLGWVVGGALIGHGVELNLDKPTLQPKPGGPFLFAGVTLWYLPYALLRSTRRDRPAASAQ